MSTPIPIDTQAVPADSSRTTIDLRKGHPSSNNLPNSLMATACREASKRLEAGELSLQYPTSCHGTPNFLQSLGEFLGEAYGDYDHDEENVLVTQAEERLLTTNGASHGLELCCATFTKPGDAVWVETPSYFLAHRVFQDHGLSVRGMRTDPHGLVVDTLAEDLEAGVDPPPRLLYVVPSHGNPSGAVLPLERRVALLNLARKYRFLIVSDDVYHLLDWTNDTATAEGSDCVPPPPRLVALDACSQTGKTMVDTNDSEKEDEEEDEVYTNFDRDDYDNDAWDENGGVVISIGSFTKILSPALRLGWLESSPKLLARVAARGYIVSGGTVAPFVSEVAYELLRKERRSLFFAHVARLTKTLETGAAILMDRLRSHPDCFEVLTPPKGGFFVWVKLKLSETSKSEDVNVDVYTVLPVAERHGVVFLPGPICAPHAPPSTCARYVRLCFANEESDRLAEGVERLAAAVAEVQRQHTTP